MSTTVGDQEIRHRNGYPEEKETGEHSPDPIKESRDVESDRRDDESITDIHGISP